MRIVRQIRNIAISACIILAVIIGAGVAYVWYNGQVATVPITKSSESKPYTSVPVVSQPKPAANAPESVSVQSLTSPVKSGTNASITVKTNPLSTCQIAVTYNKIVSKDSGLSKHQADEFGMVSWTWSVGTSVPAGTWPVDVSCSYNNKTAKVQAMLQVTK